MLFYINSPRKTLITRKSRDSIHGKKKLLLCYRRLIPGTQSELSRLTMVGMHWQILL